jgi:hypothetical protein
VGAADAASKGGYSLSVEEAEESRSVREK